MGRAHCDCAAKLHRSKSRWWIRARAARTRLLPAIIPSTSTSACMAGRHLFFFSFFSLLLILRFVFVCRPLSMSNSLGAKSSGLYFSRVCPASFDVFVRLWLLFLLYPPIPLPSGVLLMLCFHYLMYQHQKISFWNVYPPFCGLLHRF
jgi:hypothetical protein